MGKFGENEDIVETPSISDDSQADKVTDPGVDPVDIVDDSEAPAGDATPKDEPQSVEELLGFIFGDEDEAQLAEMQAQIDRLAAAPITPTEVVAPPTGQESAETAAQVLAQQALELAAPFNPTELTYLDKVRQTMAVLPNANAPTTPQAAPVTPTSANEAEMPTWAKDMTAQNAALMTQVTDLKGFVDTAHQEKREIKMRAQRAEFDATVADPAKKFYIAADVRDDVYDKMRAYSKELRSKNIHNTRLPDLLKAMSTKWPTLIASEGKAEPAKTKRRVLKGTPPAKNRPKGGVEPDVLAKPESTPMVNTDETFADCRNTMIQNAAKLFPN